MINSSISLPVVVSLPSHVADDSWTGSERQVTFCYLIATTTKKPICLYIFTLSVFTDGPLFAGQSLCDPGHSSLVSFHSGAELLQAALHYVSGDVLTNIEVFSFGTNPWSQTQPQPGDEAHSWGRPWACPPEPLLWRAWRKIQLHIRFSIFVFRFHS